jgi:raffinose/stachyose/melibiose transport system substrate-binding protein
MGLAACSGGDDDGGGSDSGGNVEMTLWHNATTGPGKAFWDKTVADFQTANPTVKIKIQSIQNEDLDGKLQTSLNSGSAPDLFLQRGGGKMAAMVEAGQLKDITGDITDATKQAVGDAALGTGQVDGKTYSVPVSILPGGFW